MDEKRSERELWTFEQATRKCCHRASWLPGSAEATGSNFVDFSLAIQH